MPFRVVEICCDAFPPKCHSLTPIPAALHTCQESRQEALKIYTLTFGTVGRARTSHRFFFDFSGDILLFPDMCDENLCLRLAEKLIYLEIFVENVRGVEKVQTMTVCTCFIRGVFALRYLGAPVLRLGALKKVSGVGLRRSEERRLWVEDED